MWEIRREIFSKVGRNVEESSRKREGDVRIFSIHVPLAFTANHQETFNVLQLLAHPTLRLRSPSGSQPTHMQFSVSCAHCFRRCVRSCCCVMPCVVSCLVSCPALPCLCHAYSPLTANTQTRPGCTPLSGWRLSVLILITHGRTDEGLAARRARSFSTTQRRTKADSLSAPNAPTAGVTSATQHFAPIQYHRPVLMPSVITADKRDQVIRPDKRAAKNRIP